MTDALVEYFKQQGERIIQNQSVTDYFWQDEQGKLVDLVKPILLGAAQEAAAMLDLNVDTAVYQTALIKKVDHSTRVIAKEITRNSRLAVEAALAQGLKADLSVTLRSVLESILGMGRAAMIGGTETVRAWSGGQVAVLEQLPDERLQWHTAQDELVDDICARLNDSIRKVGSAFGNDIFGEVMYAPPAHPNCRCTATRYVE